MNKHRGQLTKNVILNICIHHPPSSRLNADTLGEVFFWPKGEGNRALMGQACFYKKTDFLLEHLKTAAIPLI